jgi:RHS repeat-associated protein
MNNIRHRTLLVLDLYLVYDQVGSLRLVADSAGNVVKRIDYDSFGNIIANTNEEFKIPFGFAGGLHDRDTRMVRFGIRDYDPDVGRWTAKDPIFFAGGDTDLYGYVLDDPVNLIDTSGLELTSKQKLIVSITSGAGAVVGAVAFGATTWGIGSVGGAMIGSSLFGALAASLMGGDLADIANAGISGAASAAVGVGTGKVIYWLSNRGIQAAIYTGLATGGIDSVIFGADPVFGEEIKPSSLCK